MSYRGVRAAIAVPAVAVSVTAMSVGAAIAVGATADRGGVPAVAETSSRASIALSNCRTHLSDFITNENTSLGTSSSTFVAVPGMTKRIFTGGTTSGCVIVTVSGFSFANADALQFARVTLDGVPGNPSQVQWSGDDDEDTDGRWAREHAAVFAFGSVAPGAHVVRFEHRSLVAGQSVFMHRPAMHIEHQ